MKAPTNFRELLAYLERNPRVRITGPTPQSREDVTRDEGFSCYHRGCLWFQPNEGEPHFIPISCTLTEAAAKSETGLIFESAGFTVEKFGRKIRVEYLP